MTSGGATARAAALARLATHARWQSGVFSRAQARASGISPTMIRSRLASGAWLSYRGVLRLATSHDGAAARAWAALLRGGPGTVLTGTSALFLRGRVADAPVPMVCLPRDRHVHLPQAHVLREPHEPPGTVLYGGYRLATHRRAVVDALRLLPMDQAVDLADSLGGAGDDIAGLIADWRAGHPGARGNAQLLRIQGLVGDRARSRAERRLHRILRGAGIHGWVANLPVHDPAGFIGIVDVGFAAERVAIEVDGRAYHSAADAFQRDRTRQNRLVRAGWTVLRFTWDDLTRRPEQVAATVHAVLAQARLRAGA